MTTIKDNGLTRIAQSMRKTPATTPSERKPVWAPPADEKPPLELKGRPYKTSIAVDLGLWDCAGDTARVLTKRLRAMGRGSVHVSKVLETAFIAFHELTLDQQIELVRRCLER